ncbi:MAG: methionyl-tRNA formyltransferase [Pseudomonadota bacterium]
MTQPLRIVFAGTPDFAVPSLQALLDSEHQVVAVYTQPDRPAGRGRKLAASPVKTLALQAGLPVIQPTHFKDATTVSALAAWQPDLMIVVAYGLLLPAAVLSIPALGCINVHASLLPRWRGAAPIQRAIAGGDRETGISIMQMDVGLDTGPVFLTRSVPIEVTDNAQTLSDKLAAQGAAALLDTLPGITDGSLIAEPQATGATYAHRLKKTEARVDWHQPAVRIACQIRAFNPWPVAQTRWQDQVLRIWQAQPSPSADTSAPAGTVLQADAAGILVATDDGSIRITQLQLPGKKAVSAADFVNAHDIVGAQLS